MDLAKFMINYNAMCHGTNLTSPIFKSWHQSRQDILILIIAMCELYEKHKLH